MNRDYKLLVCDLDNTLYDWVTYFVKSFYAMAEVASEILNCDMQELLLSFKSVHQLHNDSEHPFALLETSIVKGKYPQKSLQELAEILDPALYAFNKMRVKELKLYPGVIDVLEELSKRRIKIVAHTESKTHAVIDRLRRLSIHHYVSKIYCRERAKSQHPDQKAATKFMNNFPTEKIFELSKNQIKPDPNVLKEICLRENTSPEMAVYIGDSMARDIMMANNAGVFSVFAAYGTTFNKTLYDDLVKITHWTQEDVQREIKLKEEAKDVKPDFVANSFSDLLEVFE